MESFLGAPVTAGGRVFGNIYLTEKRAASEFSVEDEEALVILAGQAGVAIANAVLYEESQSQQRWLEALRRITGAILAGCDLEELLEMVADSSRDLVHADLATIITPSGPEDGLVVVAATGKGAAALRGRQVPAGDSISGDVIRKAEPAILDNVSLDPRSLGTKVREAEMGPTIYVPLRTRGRAFGTLTVANQIGGAPFTPGALHLIETFADQASVAIEYARAQQELERLAVMEERERIARELHDGIIQSLFAVGMHLQAAASLAEPAMEQRIERAVAEIDRSIRDLRNYIFGLRPGILADRQLAQAIEDLADDLSRNTGVTTHPEVDKTVAADLSTRSTDVVQVIREALSNVQRHARATRCWIQLARSDGTATLIIRDDGEGFDPAGHPTGQGLANMRDRARNLGGNLSISAAPGQGTTLRFVLPL
jgi:signal transduction histidine kinase